MNFSEVLERIRQQVRESPLIALVLSSCLTTAALSLLSLLQPAPQPVIQVKEVVRTVEVEVIKEVKVEVERVVRVATRERRAKESASAKSSTVIRTPILLGLSASGEAIVGYKKEAYSLMSNIRAQGMVTDTTLSETASISSSSAEMSKAKVAESERSVQVTPSLSRYAVELRFGDAWWPSSTVACVSGASGWLGCVERLDLSVWARLGDSPAWVGAGGGLKSWHVGVRYEW